MEVQSVLNGMGRSGRCLGQQVGIEPLEGIEALQLCIWAPYVF